MVTTGPNTGDEVSVPGRQDMFPHIGSQILLGRSADLSCGTAPCRLAARLRIQNQQGAENDYRRSRKRYDVAIRLPDAVSGC